MLLQFHKFLAVNDGSGSISDPNQSPAETYDLLDTDEAEVIDLEGEKDVKKSAEKKGSKDEEIPIETTERGETDEEEEESPDELEELERELEEPDEEKLELVTPVRRKEILAKYPKLFKDFPYLEKAYYRDQQFTEIYPTIDDARAANEKAENLGAFENDLMQGNSENVLKVIKRNDGEAFNRIADNYMLALYNTDQTAYNHVVGNLNKQLIAAMVNEGKKRNDESFIQAAAIVNQYVFGTPEWSPPTRLGKDITDPRQDEVAQREQQFNQRQFDTARTDLGTRLTNSFKATIEQNIDRTESMTEYVKKAACQDAMEQLERLIGADRGFQKLKDKLWIAAAQQGYSKPAMDRIRSAFATKAKTLLPVVLRKARNEALKGLGKRVSKSEDTEDLNDGSTRPSKDRKTTSSPRSSGNSYKDKASKIPKEMSTLDYFNQD